MENILYGNLSIDILDGQGAHVNRLSVRGGPPSLILRPFRAHERSAAPLLGRDEQISDVDAAVRSHRPIEFTATCGYGKSALLQHIRVLGCRYPVRCLLGSLRSGGQRAWMPVDRHPRRPASLRLVNGPLEAYQVARGVLFLNKGLADCGVAHAQSSACS